MRFIMLTLMLSSCLSEKDIDNKINKACAVGSEAKLKVSELENLVLENEDYLIDTKIQSDWNDARLKKIEKILDYHYATINMLDAKEKINKFCIEKLKKLGAKKPKIEVDYIIGVSDNNKGKEWSAGCLIMSKGQSYFVEYSE